MKNINKIIVLNEILSFFTQKQPCGNVVHSARRHDISLFFLYCDMACLYTYTQIGNLCRLFFLEKETTHLKMKKTRCVSKTTGFNVFRGKKSRILSSNTSPRQNCVQRRPLSISLIRFSSTSFSMSL